jgi:hypothetical protein
MEMKPVADELTIDNFTLDPKYIQTEKHHALVRYDKENKFMDGELRYIEVFYPNEFLLPFTLAENVVDREITVRLKINGYAFVELDLKIDNLNQPKINQINSLTLNNIYNRGEVSKPTRFRYKKHTQYHMVGNVRYVE